LASYLAGEPTDSNDIEPVIAGSGFVRASRGRDAVEQRREHDADGKIERERVERRVARNGEAIDYVDLVKSDLFPLRDRRE